MRVPPQLHGFHLALLHSSSVNSGSSNSSALPAAHPLMQQQQAAAQAAALAGAAVHDVNAPANILAGNNGINPVSANQPSAVVAHASGRSRRTAADHVTLALRDELFDQARHTNTRAAHCKGMHRGCDAHALSLIALP